MTNSSFPPSSTHQDQIGSLIDLFNTVLPPGHQAWYVSSPITTGRRRVGIEASRTQRSMTEEFVRQHVIEPNRRDAQEYVQRLRDAQSRYVIDPTALNDIPGWGQDDYRYFWGKVIELFASTVIFRDGWEFSSGCSYEFLVAVRSDLRVLDERLAPLELKDGMSLLAVVINNADPAQMNIKFLTDVLTALETHGMQNVAT
jgi:hypothetical protein